MSHTDKDKHNTHQADAPPEENVIPTPPDGGAVMEEAPTEEAARITELEQALSEEKDRHMRLMAEYDNYRKRTQRERENLYADIQAATLSAFLGVADNFARAMEAPCADPDFKKGMALIHTGFTETLGRFGVEMFGAPGDTFDPGIHEAVAHLADENVPAGCISLVYSPGYKMKEKILRPATVVVASENA